MAVEESVRRRFPGPKLRTRCQRRVEELVARTGVPVPWCMDSWLDRLEFDRGRPIDLCAIKWTQGDAFGAWRAQHDHDVIAYPANTSGPHQDHIILHEVAHMVCGHRGKCILSNEDAQRLAPDLHPAAFAHLLDRATGADDEQEAELLASLLYQRLTRAPQVTTEQSTIARVEYVFGE